MATPAQIEQFKREARRRGIPEAVISNTIAKNMTRNAKTAVTSGGSKPLDLTKPTPGLDFNNTPTPKPGLVRNIVNTVTAPAKRFGEFALEAGAQGVRAAVDPNISFANPLKREQRFVSDDLDQQAQSLFQQERELIAQAKQTKDKKERDRLIKEARKLRDAAEVVGNRADQIAQQPTTFLEDEEDLTGRGKILETGARRTAGAASYVIPAGRGVSGAIRTGMTLGGLSAFSQDDAGFEDVATGVATGAVIGGTFALAGKGLKWVSNTGKAKAVKQNLLKKIGKNLRADATQIKVKPSVYGAKKEKLIQETLDELGIVGGPQEKYEQLQPALESLSQQIDDILSKSPDVEISVTDLANSFRSKLKSEIRTKSLTSKAAQDEIKGYLQDLLKEIEPSGMSDDLTLATTKPDALGKVNTVSLKNLFRLKKIVNKDYGSIANKLERGTPLTDREKIVFYGRQVLDEAITKAKPEIKDLTVMQSHLYDAARPLASARATVPTFRVFGNTIPKYRVMQDMLGRGFEATGEKLDKLFKFVDPIKGTLKQGYGKLNNKDKELLFELVARLPIIASTADNAKQPTDNQQDYSDPIQNQRDNDYRTNNIQQESQITPPTDLLTDDTESLPQSQAFPTKQEFLREAFKRGATMEDVGRLEQIYELFAPQSDSELSDQFLETGEPQTRADRLWALENPDKVPGARGKATEKERMFENASIAAQQALTLLDSGVIKTGPGQGTLGKLGEKTGTNTQDQQRYRASIALARTTARNALLGANMTEKELESIEAFIPEYNDAPDIAEEKLRTFIELMNQFSGL